VKPFLAVLAVIVIAGCSLPQWRVGQAKIDPKLAEKPAAQIEAEREAASYIAKRSAPPVPAPAVAVADIHAVATGLSSSLGEPARVVTVDDRDAIVASLRAGLLAEQKKAAQWKAFAQKYAGKPIEETGVNLAGPAGLLALVGVVAACVACPALGYLLLRIVPVLWGFFRRTTAAVAEFATENPSAGEQLAVKLSRRMDEAHKALVRRKAPRIPRIEKPVSA
jgi:hypothetical protein